MNNDLKLHFYLNNRQCALRLQTYVFEFNDVMYNSWFKCFTFLTIS